MSIEDQTRFLLQTLYVFVKKKSGTAKRRQIDELSERD